MRPMLVTLAGLLWATALSAQTVAPTIVDKVEPEYEATSAAYLLDPTQIEVDISESGKVFGLKSATGIPDNVVKAMRLWVFKPGTRDGVRTPFGIPVIVPVRRPMTEYLDKTRLYVPSGKSAGDGADLTPEKALAVEQGLQDDAKSVESREALVRYAARAGGSELAALRARQILWLVRNKPDAPVLATGAGLVLEAPPGSSDESYATVRSLWLAQAARHPDNPAILRHSSLFLSAGDPEKVGELLIPQINRVSGAAAWLGSVYGLTALGVNGMNPNNGEPEIDAKRPNAEAATHARGWLAQTDDHRVLLSALATVAQAGRTLQAAGKPGPEFAEFCGGLLTRVKTFYPEVRYSCSTEGAAAPAKSAVVHLTSPHLKDKVAPQYPPDAKALHMQGTVRFTGVIAVDGGLREVELLSGPLIFYKAARDAVVRWKYEPTYLNDRAVEVVTQINVNFAMGR